PASHMWALSRKQALLSAASPNSSSQHTIAGYAAIVAFLGCFIFALGTLWLGMKDETHALWSEVSLPGFFLAQVAGWVALFLHCRSGLWFSTKFKDPTRRRALANTAWWLGILSGGVGCTLILRILALVGGSHRSPF